jgi:hypothetical protein
MNTIPEGYRCSCCGAPATSEICPYCNCRTGIITENANMEYPVINCKEAHVGFWNVVFPAIFAVAFGFGTVFGFFSLFTGMPYATLMSLPFAIISIVSSYIVISTLYRNHIIKKHGKRIEATVYGYMDDNLLINERPAQIVKLLINTRKWK